MKAFRWTCVLAAAAFGLAAAPATAQETTLIFATTNNPQAHLNVRVHHPWAQRINEAGKGVVRIDVRDGPTLANHTNYYSRVVDDVVQIAWGIHSFVPGKFPLTDVATLPYEVEKAADGSVALWRLLQAGALGAEYKDIVPLYICTLPQNSLHMAKPIKAIDDLSGLKVISGAKVGTEIITRLGGNPVSLPITGIYEAVQRGTADGFIVPWTGFQPFKLAEVSAFHVDTLWAGSSGLVFMSKKRYDALPAAARKVIDDNSGEAQSKLFGAFWDSVQDEGRNMVKGMDKHTVVTYDPAQDKAIRDKIAPVTEAWVKATPGAEPVLKQFRETLAKVKSGS
ncbi:MAG: TRAP transporter substrate-binding protein [Rhodospirillales bacterium]